MNATGRLHGLGQSLWLDNITRDLLDSGRLQRYIDELSVTGLTSNPTIFDHAIKASAAYDAAIRAKDGTGTSAEALFFELALDDLGRAADLFRPAYEQSDGVDGWVSLEVSPLLAYDTASTVVAAKALFVRAKRRRNLLIKIPGTREGLPAIEEAIFAGVPVNVTLLFSREHYLAAAEAFLRGVERRVAAGLNPNVGSVASVFVSRWDASVAQDEGQEQQLDPPREVPAPRPRRHSDERAEQREGQAKEHRDAEAVDEPGEEIASLVVGAEPVLARGWRGRRPPEVVVHGVVAVGNGRHDQEALGLDEAPYDGIAVVGLGGERAAEGRLGIGDGEGHVKPPVVAHEERAVVGDQLRAEAQHEQREEDPERPEAAPVRPEVPEAAARQG